MLLRVYAFTVGVLAICLLHIHTYISILSCAWCNKILITRRVTLSLHFPMALHTTWHRVHRHPLRLRIYLKKHAKVTHTKSLDVKSICRIYYIEGARGVLCVWLMLWCYTIRIYIRKTLMKICCQQKFSHITSITTLLCVFLAFYFTYTQNSCLMFIASCMLKYLPRRISIDILYDAYTRNLIFTRARGSMSLRIQTAPLYNLCIYKHNPAAAVQRTFIACANSLQISVERKKN